MEPRGISSGWSSEPSLSTRSTSAPLCSPRPESPDAHANKSSSGSPCKTRPTQTSSPFSS
eukprot:9576431-Heterocapsa_arctica.AAC.1